MRKGPHLVMYDFRNEERLSSIDFGALKAGIPSQEVIVWLWNKKGFSDAPDAVDVRIGVLAANKWAEEIVSGGHLKVRSSGVLDPDGRGIQDDGEIDFSEMTGGLLQPGAFHSLGNIPTNCARRLWFKLELDEEFEVAGVPKVLLQVGYLSAPGKWLYVKDE